MFNKSLLGKHKKALLKNVNRVLGEWALVKLLDERNERSIVTYDVSSYLYYTKGLLNDCQKSFSSLAKDAFLLTDYCWRVHEAF